MKRTKWIALMLALCMVIGFVPMNASAAMVAEGACGENGEMRWTLESNGVLTITGEGATDDWAYSGPDYSLMPWRNYADDILSVVISEGVTRIGDYAFSGCHKMSTISFPSTLTSIGQGAFFDCDGFKNFTIPDTVTDLEKSVFGHCSNLKKVKLPKGITALPEGMFKDCAALEEFVVPDTVTAIGGSIFASCYSLKSVKLPEGLTEIPVSAFKSCEKLTSITIPSTVESIGDNAFEGCMTLNSINLPEGLLEIGSNVFVNANKITSVTVPSTVVQLRHTFERADSITSVNFLGHAPLFASNVFGDITVTVYYPQNYESWTEDILQDYAGTVTWVGYVSDLEPSEILAKGVCGDNVTWTLKPNGTLVISGTGSMNSARTQRPWEGYVNRITAVEIQSGVTTIGEYSFNNCVNLKRITIPDTVVTIENYSFSGCTGLEEIVIPESVKSIQARTFEGCTALKKVSMGDGVKTVGESAFSGCTVLSDVKLSFNLEVLENSAFYQCAALKTIQLPNTLTAINNELFAQSGLEQIVIPEQVTVIGLSAFNDCALRSVTIPAGVREVGSWAFSNCTKLTTVYFEAEVAPTIAAGAFENVTATVHYPGAHASWDEVAADNYGGNLTWVSIHTHSYTSEITAPTCTEQGYTTYTCSGCGNVYQDNYVDALGHDYVSPTYLSREEGHRYTCSRCGDVKIEACSFDGGTVVKEATLHSSGVKKYTCTVCGGSYEASYQYRIAGTSRIDTAIAVADQLKEVLGVEKFDAIIIANGDNFADALAGSYLAARKNAPILQHRNSGQGDDKNEAYIQENLIPGGTVYLLGGELAVPASIEENLTALGYNVVRLAGTSRFDTNLAILNEAGVAAGDEILIATGWDFADCLSASATGKPILMINTKLGQLTDAQMEFLTKYQNNSFTIVGGTVAVSEDMEAAVEAIVGDVDRVFGTSREDTSVAIAERYFSDPDCALIAYSRNFPDGLCGGPLANAMKAPLILVNAGREAAAVEYVAENGIAKGIVLGGALAISDETVQVIFGE